jgi:uncharacterized protein YeaO (DUF488 family)
MLKVYTSQYSYKGADRLDITVKSGQSCFAPTWEIVMNYKSGMITEEQYASAYLSKMRLSYQDNRIIWDKLLQKDRIVLVCFCKAKSFCHRLLLADILVKLGAEYKGEI